MLQTSTLWIARIIFAFGLVSCGNMTYLGLIEYTSGFFLTTPSFIEYLMISGYVVYSIYYALKYKSMYKDDSLPTNKSYRRNLIKLYIETCKHTSLAFVIGLLFLTHVRSLHLAFVPNGLELLNAVLYSYVRYIVMTFIFSLFFVSIIHRLEHYINGSQRLTQLRKL